jgi:hypothetical protein
VPDQSIGMTPLVQRIAQVVKHSSSATTGPWQAGLAIAAALLVGAFAAIPADSPARDRRRRRGARHRRCCHRGAAGAWRSRWRDYFNTRNVLFALPVFVVLAGGGFARVRPRAAGVAAVAARRPSSA